MLKSGINELTLAVMQDFREMLGVNGYGVFISRKAREERIRAREMLRTALRKCGSGDAGSKIFVCDHIAKLLLTKYDLTERDLDMLIKTESPRDKFLYMLYQYKRRYKEDGLTRLLKDGKLGAGFEIKPSEIEKAFLLFPYKKMTFPEKLEYVAETIYADYKGNGVCDMLLESRLDGISGGVSGKEKYVYIMYEGRNIRLSFLKFDSDAELIRICKNIARTNHMGQLDEKRGNIVTEMSDGSRVSVSRPPFSESWAFFVRSFKSGEDKTIRELVTGKGAEEIIKLLSFLIKGNTVCAITGEMGAGKTTLLASLIEFVPKGINIRVTETSSELHLSKRYPDRNILAFRETEQISVQNTLDFAKKTDGGLTILGEAASLESISYLIQLTQTASAFTLFTHHALTTEKLLYYMRNALLSKGGFSDERLAMEQALNAISVDIHLGKTPEGKRYIERVTEVVKSENTEKMYEIRDLFVREGGAYLPKDMMSKELIRKISMSLDKEEAGEFAGCVRRWWNTDGKNII